MGNFWLRLKEWWAAYVLAWREFVAEEEFELYCAEKAGRCPRFVGRRERRWTAMVMHARAGASALRCVLHGHELHADDWAGPDTGGMGLYCGLCSWSWHHTLY